MREYYEELNIPLSPRFIKFLVLQYRDQDQRGKFSVLNSGKHFSPESSIQLDICIAMLVLCRNSSKEGRHACLCSTRWKETSGNASFTNRHDSIGWLLLKTKAEFHEGSVGSSTLWTNTVRNASFRYLVVSTSQQCLKTFTEESANSYVLNSVKVHWENFYSTTITIHEVRIVPLETQIPTRDVQRARLCEATVCGMKHSVTMLFQ